MVSFSNQFLVPCMKLPEPSCNMCVVLLFWRMWWSLAWAKILEMCYCKAGSPSYGPRAKCGPRIHFIRPAKPFCQW